MLWIPVTIFAAFAQTVRNAAQRQLLERLGTLGATLVRFLYAIPFSLLWLVLALHMAALSLPAINSQFILWVAIGGISQIVGTALLLLTMVERNFAVGVAYAKTEVVQLAVLSWIVLGDTLDGYGVLAVAFGTLALLLLTPSGGKHPFRALITGLFSRSALYGTGCGACMALASVAARGAIDALHASSFFVNAAVTVLAIQLLQAVVLGGWLGLSNRTVLLRVFKLWRPSLIVGLTSAAASVGWLTAFALKPVTYVRTLGLLEMVFSYVVSRRLFKEAPTRREIAAMVLMMLAVGLIVAG